MRLSKEDGNVYGIEAQRAAIEAWAARERVCVALWCADEGVPGSTPPDKRPGLKEAINAIRRGDVLVVAKWDRLARDPAISFSVEKVVSGAGGCVASAGDAGNGDRPEDAFLRGILHVAAAYERDMIRMRTKAGLERARAAGKRIGAVGVEVERPEVAEKIKEMRALGLGYKAIATQLNLESVAPPKGRRARAEQWYPESVKRVLRRVGDPLGRC